MTFGFVQSNLYNIIHNVRLFICCYLYKIEICVHFGPKKGIFRTHKYSNLTLLPLNELGLTFGFVQSNLYNIIHNVRLFICCYLYKIEICVHFGPKKGNSRTHKYSILTLLPLNELGMTFGFVQ